MAEAGHGLRRPWRSPVSLPEGHIVPEGHDCACTRLLVPLRRLEQPSVLPWAHDAGQVRFYTPGLARCVFTRRAAYSPRPPHRAGDGGRAAARGQRPRPACPCLPIPTSWRRLQAHSATAPQSVHAVRAVPRAWWRLGGATHRFLVLILLRLPAPRGANSFLLPHSAIEVVRLHGGCRGLAAPPLASAANSARG